MNRELCTSRTISAFGYDEETQTLEVAFQMRKRDSLFPVYAYSGVPAELVAAMRAEGASIGSLIQTRVKNGGYEYTLLGAAETPDGPIVQEAVRA